MLRQLIIIVFILAQQFAGCKSSTGEESSAQEETTVYVTATGKRYHRANCSSLSKSKKAVSLADAIAGGYTPCGNCHPPAADSIKH